MNTIGSQGWAYQRQQARSIRRGRVVLFIAVAAIETLAALALLN